MVTDGVTVVGGTVIAVDGYLSFGSYGEYFYGLRDNSGELEYKESGGIWKKIKEAWPIGSYYLNNGDDPATQLGYGTWVYVGRLAVIYMKKYLISLLLVLLAASVVWAALWSDYSELSVGTIADSDDFLVRDVSDTSQGPAGTLKRYTWSSINTRIPSPATDDTWQGSVMTVTVGENVSQWDLLYAKNSSGSLRWYKYDANGTDKYYAPRAIALSAITSGNSGSVGLGDGIARNGGWGHTSNQDEGKSV